MMRFPLRLAGAAGVGVTGASLYLHDAEEEYRSIPEASLPHRYEPAAIDAVWSSHPRCVAVRLGQIGTRVVPFAARLLLDAVCRRTESPTATTSRHETRARELRSLLTSLGPTFIKFGQMLSIRPDVLPPVAVYELQKLCDSVPSYPTEQALGLIEEELGRPVGDLFEGLDNSTEPIAAASLGQVYRC